MDRARHCVKDQKHGPAIVRSVGDDGAVHRAAYWGAQPDPKLPAQPKLSVDRHKPFVPLRRKVLDLLEIQDRWIAFADDCRPLAFFGYQGHRSGYRRAQFHRAVICQGDELFRVEGHCGMPMLMAGSKASTCTPDAHL